MPARVKWIEGKTFLGIDVNGKSTVMSSPEGPGVSPMQMLLLGLGGCSLVDVVIILQKQRQPFAGVEVEIDGVRAEEAQRPWKDIHLHFIVTGGDVDPAKVERAIALSVEKYCGAYATLSGVATITHDFEMRGE
ncbi:MAG: OsmC family protein [Caldilineaceae bacterium]|nr:OsmC family protein [Caldilineaceae bacterium]HRJ40951.1 OsmC family protein [Caldilineaceae bacterium]